MEPLFKDFYTDKYDKEEFLLDVDVEFSKIKRLLNKNPRVLREDPVLSIDYLKIIGLIRQQKMLEDTSEAYDPEAAYKNQWQDVEVLQRDKAKRAQSEFDAFQKQRILEGESAGERMRVGGFEEETEDQIKQSKKKEAKEHQKII